MDVCILCKSSKKDDIQYGEFLKNKNFGVHTFCLYLSSNLAQNGNDDEDFLGFLVRDIYKEVKRISLLKCCFCNNNYANIGCCEKRCHRTFHLICGIENKAENRFCHDYRSYCTRHARKVKERPSANETCLICFESLCAPGEKFNRVAMILTPCCRNGWFHKLCLQRFAKTAGYFFKCPLCNDDKVFREKLPAKGIFIPNQDAAWELEPNAFAELLERPNKCAAERCKNRRGRKAQSDTNPFIMCHACGSTAIHKLCLPNNGKQFSCADCSIAKEDHDSGRESLNSHANHNEDEYIDVCHVSDKEDLEIINRLIATSSKMTENKRDSGTKMDTDSSDEEIPQTSKNCRKFAESNKNAIKPRAVRQTGRIRLETECSESQEETNKGKRSNEEIQEKNNLTNECNAKRSVTTDSNSNDYPELENLKVINLNTMKNNNEFENDEEPIKSFRERKCSIIPSDSEDELVSPKTKRFKSINTERENAQNLLRILIDLPDENSDDSDGGPLENFNKGKRLIIHSDSEDELVSPKPKRFIGINTERENAHNLSCILIDSPGESSDDSNGNPLENFNKRKSLKIHSDSEHEFVSPKPKRFIDINTERENAHNLSRILINLPDEGSDDSDDDPVENFNKIIQKNASKRTSNLDELLNERERDHEESETSNSGNQAKNKTNDQNKNRKLVKLKENDNEKPQNNLDISCIAKRTRRKTICSGRSNQVSATKQNTENGDPFNISCIALRTRRKTICGQTDFSKKTDHEKSQIYEKVHSSNETLETLTEDEDEDCEQESYSNTNTKDEDENSEQESCSNTNSKDSNFIVKDSYNEKDSKLEISCIANRTRKRKSITQQQLPRIVDVSDCSSESSMSSDMCYNNNKLRKRSNYRINSYSSEDFETTRPRQTKKTASSKLEKFPVQDFTAVLKTINKKSYNYHPSHSYHPHSSNRNRF